MQEGSKSSGSKLSSYLNLLGIIAVLVIAPAVSWYYLKKGITYRKAALVTLEPKDLDKTTSDYISPYLKNDGQAKLIKLPKAKTDQSLDLLYKIDDRIIEKPLFEIIALADTLSLDKPKKINNISFVQMKAAYSGNYDYILLDTGNVVRATYIDNEDIAKDIIRHLAIVIPMQKKKTIQLERQKKAE